MLVNPVQSFHPNSPPPNDAVMLTSERAQNRRLDRALCSMAAPTARRCAAPANMPLIFDEVYTGFRLAPGGAQEYLRRAARTWSIYGKTVAGGMPIGVVCGKKVLMRRFDPDHPMRIAYVVGTFSAPSRGDGSDERISRAGLTRPATAKLYTRNQTSVAPSGCVRPIGDSPRPTLPLRLVNLGVRLDRALQRTEPL